MKKTLCLLFLALSTLCIRAQTNITFTRIFSFGGKDGAKPSGLTFGKDGNLYGTTYQGGDFNKGTIFRITPNGTLTTLFSFDGTNGFDPMGELVVSADGRLYGTTTHGTVFRISIDGKGFTNLCSGLGEIPGGLVLAADGNLYGATRYGGKGHLGSIFRVSPNGASETVISFDGSTTGAGLNNAMIVGRDGNLYGTLSSGGKFYTGLFFRLTTNGVFSALASFNDGDNFRVSRNKLVQGADGAFYGTTEFGGAYDNRRVGNDDTGNGTVFKVTTNGSVTRIASFNGQNGAHPRGVLVQAGDGAFYGVAAHDMPLVIYNSQFNTKPTIPDAAYTSGAIFKVTTNGTITKLFQFTGSYVEYAKTNGYAPYGLITDSNGNFYGTTVLGGEKAYLAGNAYGTIFKFRVQP